MTIVVVVICIFIFCLFCAIIADLVYEISQHEKYISYLQDENAQLTNVNSKQKEELYALNTNIFCISVKNNCYIKHDMLGSLLELGIELDNAHKILDKKEIK